jgi:hypothetical protein
MRWARHVAAYVKDEKWIVQNLVIKPEGRPRTWEDNIKIDLNNKI